MIELEKHNGVIVLRDDLLPGGTKSVIMPYIVTDQYREYVYASPVYGSFQIALSIYCRDVGKKATIFCAKRKNKHPNTLRCEAAGARIVEVPHGYLSNVERKAKDYSTLFGAYKIEFGAKMEISREVLANRAHEVLCRIGFEPSEIWLAVGSGLLLESVTQATSRAFINGVMVGAEYPGEHDVRWRLWRYPAKFEKPIKYPCPFPSMPNYDLKAWEYCQRHKGEGSVLFWNVF